MYLGFGELKELKWEEIFECYLDGHEFDPASQLKVCSVDVRVDNVFWKGRRQSKVLDLGGGYIFDISPRRLWKKIIVESSGYVDLKPGEMLLGRTYEKINMPNSLVGKINTRSSFARLGLSTGCNCDLINPGYRGHVPIELINTTKGTIRLRPFMSLCQVFFMRIDVGDSSYEDDLFDSKYHDDDGGPSVWWRDKLVKKISRSTFDGQLEEGAIEALRERFNKISDQGLFRLEKIIEGRKLSGSAELLGIFYKSEKNKSRWYKFRKGLGISFFPLTVALSYEYAVDWLFASGPFGVKGVALLALTLLSIPLLVYYGVFSKYDYYLEEE